MLIHTPENQRLVELLRRVALRDHAAFNQLYDLSSACLYGVAMRLVRKRELADEILQESFINVWQHAGGYAATLSTPMTWMITIVRNKSMDRLREYKPEWDDTATLDEESDYDHDLAEQADPCQLLAAATERGELRRCLSLLEAPQRQSLTLVYYNGLSHSQVAARLQVPMGTAKAWIRRGLEQLGKCLAIQSQAPPKSGRAGRLRAPAYRAD